MSAIALYWLFLRAVLLSFSGLATVPIVREALVLNAGVLTDQRLNDAVAISQALEPRSAKGRTRVRSTKSPNIPQRRSEAITGWTGLLRASGRSRRHACWPKLCSSTGHEPQPGTVRTTRL